MTEAEWLACSDPEAMLVTAYQSILLPDAALGRKCRLAGCAFLWMVAPSIPDDAFTFGIETTEMFADGVLKVGRVQLAGLRVAKITARPGWGIVFQQVAEAMESPDPLRAASLSAWCCQRLIAESVEGPFEAGGQQAEIVRDIIGNPFRPVSLDPSWLTSTVMALARQMYESRGFTPMPILADALQDAGCETTDILDHCRSDTPHVRGCWVVDLILGKS